MKQNKIIATLLRKIADMVENDECAPDALANMAELQMEHQQDRERLKLLTTAVTLLMDEKDGTTNKQPCKIIPMDPKK